MQRKTEKGGLGRILSCMRMALCNESIADMADKLGISPTYLNSIECEIRPCTFKILEGIFVNYVNLKEIQELNLDIFSPQNVFNASWNAGLHSTLGIPLPASQTYKFLLSHSKKLKPVSESEKTSWLHKVSEEVQSFNQIPAKFFIDANFVEDLHQAVRFSLLQNLNGSKLTDKEQAEYINEVFACVTKKTTKSIVKCGQHLKIMLELVSDAKPVKLVNSKPESY